MRLTAIISETDTRATNTENGPTIARTALSPLHQTNATAPTRKRGIRRKNRHERARLSDVVRRNLRNLPKGIDIDALSTMPILPIGAFPPGTCFVPVPRVSTDDQRKNLPNQHVAFENAIRENRGEILEFCKVGYVGRADMNDHEYLDWLTAVSEFASKNNAVLLATVTNRFIRRYPISKNNQPDASDFKRLWRTCCKVPMAILAEPESSPDAQHGFHSRLGQIAKGNNGGPKPKKEAGYKKQRKEENLPEVLRLHRDGMGKRAIGKKLGIAESTVRLWIEKLQ